MTKLKSETRTCRDCGKQFSTLAIWDGNTCDECARVAYHERMARINASRAYRVDSIGGICPTQSEGMTAFGRPFYFRARHGDWTLEFGGHGDPADLHRWRSEELIAEGDDPSQGCMSDEEVLAILDVHCGGAA
jgi:hypothetical protein